MKIKTLFYVLVAAMGTSFTSCSTDVETIEIQDLKTYDGQYFQNLRDFKKSDHENKVQHHGVSVS